MPIARPRPYCGTSPTPCRPLAHPSGSTPVPKRLPPRPCPARPRATRGGTEQLPQHFQQSTDVQTVFYRSPLRPRILLVMPQRAIRAPARFPGARLLA
ncbi:hypothetical protein EJ06DRAFT_534864 [Trichodelitschia bisporula]|uniref:Uncharacterized protein n=1 Tax=Trichodelitschia bisporula TaxID=703511 RepID=A0A6G1HI58_9PEZI|nr:hypothetical protein EJ06DRAFT_534864 [Trichodelitschia bisporula]